MFQPMSACMNCAGLPELIFFENTPSPLFTENGWYVFHVETHNQTGYILRLYLESFLTLCEYRCFFFPITIDCIRVFELEHLQVHEKKNVL